MGGRTFDRHERRVRSQTLTNPGLIPGLNADGWRRYEPKFLCAGAGGETQPTGITNGSLTQPPFGRYLILDHTAVIVEQQFAFFGSSGVGAGAAYVMSLPFPANRWSGPGVAAPIPLGIGMCYFSGSVAPNANMPTTLTLADPFASLAGAEDYYVQAYTQYLLSWGTGTIASGTATITHRCGYAPRAEDIEITPTDAVNINTSSGLVKVLNITSTAFDVAVANTVSGMSFSWKVRGKPPTGQAGALIGPTTPWDWTRATGATQGNIFNQFTYEPRR